MKMNNTESPILQTSIDTKDVEAAFSATVRRRVNSYFKENQLERRANTQMIIKTLIIGGFYFGIYFTILFSGISNLFLLFTLWSLLGLGQAMVGMSIMHDKVHGSYSKNRIVQFILEIPIIAIGVESLIWKIEHNHLHHHYTNIDGIDEDLEPRFVFRFTDNQPRKWYHQFQHLYGIFFYGFLIINWVTIKDFNKARKYYKKGLIKSKSEFTVTLMSILLKKSLFFGMFLVIPLLIMDQPAYLTILMFLSMLFISGVIMSLIFQCAHVLPKCSAENVNVTYVQNYWHIHQMKTTSNFAMKNRLFTYVFGGLNYQIEHHLFPEICHIYYPEISSIVQKAANDFELPYHVHQTFRSALFEHFKLLKEKGGNP